MSDLLHVLRGLARAPGFTAVAVLTLSVGIAANVTVYALIEAVLLRPLSRVEPERVVRLGMSAGGGEPSTRFAFGYADYRDIREHAGAFSGLAATALTPFVMRAAGDNAEILGEIVSGQYFPLLQVAGVRGRPLGPDDDRAGAAPVAIISRRAEERHFAGGQALGQTVFLNGQPYTVVGVAPEAFGGTFVGAPIDAWLPLESAGAFFARDWRISREQATLSLLARLAPGATRARAQQELESVAARIARDRQTAREQVRLHLLDGRLLQGAQRQGAAMFAVVLAVLVGLVLLIVCANVANLLLARGLGLRRQLAIRLALGAGRRRLMAMVMAESLVLAGLGGAVGLALAAALVGSLSTFDRLPTLTIDLALHLDGAAIAFVGALAVAAGVVLGLAPAVQASRPDLTAALRDDSGTVVGGRGVTRLRSALVVAQVAVSLLLLAAAGLFTRSLVNARQIDLGFEPASAMAIDVDVSAKHVGREEAHRLFDELARRLRARADVTRVAFSNRAPVDSSTPTIEVIVGEAPPPGRRAPEATMYAASPDYFAAVGVPILRGRPFRDDDAGQTPRVAIVNHTMARRFWPDGEAIGQRFRTSPDGPPLEIVGIARDSRYRTPGEAPHPHVYLPFAQTDGQFATVIVRTAGDPGRLLPVVRQELERLPTPLEGFFGRTLTEHLSIYLVPSELAAALAAALGSVAMLLAAVGLYGMVAYMVSQRTREIALRVALGADPARIRADVLRGAFRLLWPGCVLGLLGSIALGRVAASLLYGVGTVDPVTLAGAGAALTLVMLAASDLPARRAMRIDPADALRR